MPLIWVEPQTHAPQSAFVIDGCCHLASSGSPDFNFIQICMQRNKDRKWKAHIWFFFLVCAVFVCWKQTALIISDKYADDVIIFIDCFIYPGSHVISDTSQVQLTAQDDIINNKSCQWILPSLPSVPQPSLWWGYQEMGTFSLTACSS